MCRSEGAVKDPIFEICDPEFFPRTNFIRRAVCRLCRETCYEVPDATSQSVINVEIVRLKAHFEIAHGIPIITVKSANPTCTGKTKA
jgi:hypothetical protein